MNDRLIRLYYDAYIIAQIATRPEPMPRETPAEREGRRDDLAMVCIVDSIVRIAQTYAGDFMPERQPGETR